MQNYNKFSLIALGSFVLNVIVWVIAWFAGSQHEQLFRTLYVLMLVLPFITLISSIVSLIQIHKSKERGSIISVPLTGLMLFLCAFILFIVFVFAPAIAGMN